MNNNNAHSKYLQALPSDWDRVFIEELGSIETGGTPSRENPAYWNGSIPWVTPGELTGLNQKFLNNTRENITRAGLQNSGATLMSIGSLLVTTRATIGAVAVANIPVCTNQGFKSIVPNSRTCSDYYYHLFQFIAREFSRLASGSTFNEISRRDFAKILVPRPPLPEQCRIAEILDTADAAIQQNEFQLEKLKQLKKGLMQDLLTGKVCVHTRSYNKSDCKRYDLLSDYLT